MNLEEISIKYNIAFDSTYNDYIPIILLIFNSVELDLTQTPTQYNLDDPIILHLIGLYYRHANPNKELMLKYYSMAIEKGETDSMNNLGLYYHFTNPNKELMLKYYSMAIEKGNVNSMHNLGRYYNETNKDLMLKYYLMAIENGNIPSMYNLGWYYHKKEPNKEQMEKY